MLPLPAHALLLLTLLAEPAPHPPVWRAMEREPGRDKVCTEVPESIDAFVRERARLLPTCQLSLDVAQLTRGYVVLCGRDRGYVLYRRQRACQAAQVAVRSQRVLAPAEVAPDGTAQPDRWADVMAACLAGVTPEVVAAGLVQARVDSCECVAGWAAGPGDAARLAGQEAWEAALVRCSVASAGELLLPQAVPEAAAAMLAAAGGRPAPAAAPPAPEGAAVPTFRPGASYAEVTAALRDFPAEKVPAGDLLTATYRAPALLAYPDAGGSCVLTFVKARLDRCEGCDPQRFQCDR